MSNTIEPIFQVTDDVYYTFQGFPLCFTLW